MELPRRCAAASRLAELWRELEERGLVVLERRLVDGACQARLGLVRRGRQALAAAELRLLKKRRLVLLPPARVLLLLLHLHLHLLLLREELLRRDELARN